MAKISINKITSLSEDWGSDSRNGLPYSGQAVQDFIKEGIATANTAYAERAGASYFDPSVYTQYFFKNEEDKDLWLSGGSDSLILSQTVFNFTGTVKQVKVVNMMSSTNLYFTTTQQQSLITTGFTSQEKGITDSTWDDVMEDFYVTVAIDKGATGKYETIISEQLVLNSNTLTVDVRKYLSTGLNRVRITARGATSGEVGNLIYSATLTTMYLSPSRFTWNIPFIEGNTYSLGGMNIGGAIQKTLYVVVRNEELGYFKQYEEIIGTAIYVNNAYFFNGLEFPDSGTGVYEVELWLATETVESDHLKYKIMCVSSSDATTAKLVAINNVPDELMNYDNNTLFSYALYNGGSTVANPRVTVSYGPNTIVEETLTDIPTSAINEYIIPIEIESESTNITVEASIVFGNTQSTLYRLDNSASFPAVSEASFYLQPASRSNAQDNREVIINQANGSEVQAVWKKMNWTEGVDGYTTINGRKCLYLPAYSGVNIAYQPLASFSKGKTVDIAFSVNNIADYNEPIISICDDPTSETFRGILIYPDRIVVHTRDLNTNDLVQSYQYKENTLMSLQISYAKNYKTNYGNLVTIAVNGVKKCEFAFSGSDNIGTEANVIMGSNSADLSVYSMRVYEKSFDTPDFMQNFVNSLPTKEERVAAYEMVYSAIDDSYNVSYDNVAGKYNTMVIEMLGGAELPHYGLSKEYSAKCNLTIDILDEDADKKALSGIYLDQKIEGQGTTSMNYWVWNLRWKMDYMRITAKKNYASGTQAHKMGATAAFNDLHEAMGLTNEVGGRVAVYQYPVLGFLKTLVDGTTDQYTYTFIGMYTVGPDKGDKETFGWKNAEYKDTMMSLEGLDHNIKGAGYDYPYEKLSYSLSAESLVNDANEKATEVTNSGSAETEAEIQAKLDAEYKPAYKVAYENNPLIKGTTATLAEMNADVEAWGLQKDADGHAYQRFEFWIDGEYDILYLSRKTNQYEKNGTNLLTQLGIDASELDGMSVEEKNAYFISKRVEAFRNEAPNYWHIEDNMFYVVFMLVFGAKDNGIKNTYPYKFGTLESGSRWRQRQDDLDSLFPYDNQGLASAKFWCEWADFSDEAKTAYVFKGEHSALVQLLLLAFPDVEKDIAHRMFDAMQELSNYGSTTIDKLMGFFRTYFFDKAQYYFPKSVYNKDVEYAYEEAWPKYADGTYDVDVHPLSQVVGDALETEMEWIEKRMVYTMSKYQYGPFGANGYNDTSLGRINYRTQIAQNRTLTPAIPLYPAIANGVNTLNATQRVMDGEEVTISGAGGSNTNVYIMAAHYLSDIGDLSNLQVDSNQEAVISVASKRLKRLKVGDEVAENVTSNLAGLNIGECPSITLIDARNLSSLTGEVDLSKCPRLQEALFAATDVRNISLQNGSKLTKLSLPDSLTTLALINLKYLTEDNLEYGALANVEFFRVEECAIDGYALLKNMYSSEGSSIKNIRVIGFAYDGDATDVDMLATLANGNYSGITEDGDVDSTILPVLEGTLNVDGSIYEDAGDVVKAAFPNVKLNVSGGYYVRFADPVVQQIVAENWGDGIGTTIEQIEAVTDIGTKFSRNSEITSFDEFEKFTGVTALGASGFHGCTNLSSINLSNIENLGKYAFFNCSSLVGEIRMPKLKGYITNATFKGTNISSITNLGEITGIINNSNNSEAPFGYITTLQEVVIPDTLTTLGNYVFIGCTALSKINFPNAIKTIGAQAFGNCTSLEIEDLSLPDLESLGQNAFYEVSIKKISNLGKITALPAASYSTQNFGKKDVLEEVVLPDTLTSIPGSSFYEYVNLTSINLKTIQEIGNSAIQRTAISEVTLDNIVTIGNYAIANCQQLKKVIIGNNITSIGEYAFQSDSLLDIIIVQSSTPPSLGAGAFRYVNSGYYIYVPDESVTAYQEASNWSAYADRIKPLSEYTE